jgi:hypothetical protein
MPNPEQTQQQPHLNQIREELASIYKEDESRYNKINNTNIDSAYNTIIKNDQMPIYTFINVLEPINADFNPIYLVIIKHNNGIITHRFIYSPGTILPTGTKNL